MKNILIMRLSMERKIILKMKKFLGKISDTITNYFTKQKEKMIKNSDDLYVIDDFSCKKESLRMLKNVESLSDIEIDLLKVIISALKVLNKIDERLCKSIESYK